MVVLALGLFCTAVGLVFLVGCFIRVDSPAFIERAAGNEEKIAKLRSLQDAWSKMGKPRQFIASTSAYLIMGAGLLLLRYNPQFAHFWWVVPVLLALNCQALLHIKKYADSILDGQLSGHAEALTVIRRQIRMCVTLGVVFAILALGPNNSFKPNPLRGSA
jgi:hypothetical protein